MQSTHLFTLLLLTLLSTFTIITALPHALPNTQITHRSITFRQSSIHFPSTSHFRSLLPSSGTQYHNLFPSHNQKSKARPKSKKDTTTPSTASTVTTKPFSFTIWNILSHPESAFNNETEGGEAGGKEPTAAELSIFKGGPVGTKLRRRTFGFLRSAILWSSKVEDVKNDVEESGEGKENMLMEQGTKVDTNAKEGKDWNEHGNDKSLKELEMKKKGKGAWRSHGNGLKHSNKQSQPGLQDQTQPTAPLRLTMAGFKSWFEEAKEKEEGMEGPPQSGLQKWFGWGKKE